MNEETVTKNILKYLIKRKWKIICFDFPQSGTGKFIHPKNSKEKNKNSINPDILAYKENEVLYFENKGYYYPNDYKKISKIKNDVNYVDAIKEFLSEYKINKMRYGIGCPVDCFSKISNKYVNMVDFIIGVDSDYSIKFFKE